MKKLRIISAAALITLLTACGTTKTNTVDTQATSPNRGRTNTEATSAGKVPSTRQGSTISANTNRTTSTTTKATGRNDEATAKAKTEATAKAKTEEMFTALKMNDDQVSRFKSEWQTSMNSWSSNNRDKAMNSFERTETQDRILKDILTAAQFEKYQQWARNSATLDRNN